MKQIVLLCVLVVLGLQSCADEEDKSALDEAFMKCVGEDVPAPGYSITAPDEEVYAAAAEEAVPVSDGRSYYVDVDACMQVRWVTWLPFGSAFAVVHPKDGECEVWLGGETENPRYDGMPVQYCRFPKGCKPVALVAEDGGPITVDSPYCVPNPS